jgi:NTP pyrophosphatase (non-canonical NTP hydrolase)
MSFDELKTRLERFASDRDWDQFHSPKNLAMALSVEAAELLEHFQWLSEEASRSLGDEAKAKVAEEIADVQIYLIRLADKLGIDPLRAAANKIESNERRYPVERVKGSAKKYSDHDR